MTPKVAHQRGYSSLAGDSELAVLVFELNVASTTSGANVRIRSRFPVPDPIRFHSNSTALSSRVIDVDPPLIPDLLALVGDAADGHPAIRGIGTSTAAQPSNRSSPIEKFPSNVPGEQRDAFQEFSDAAHRRAALQEGPDDALARADPGIRGLGGWDESAAAAGAL